MSKASKSEIVIEGMLKGHAGGGAAGSEWDLIFHMMPWKQHGQAELPGGELRVAIPMSLPSIQSLMKQLPAGTAVRFTATELEPPRAGRYWVAAGILPMQHLGDHELDPVLRQARAKLDETVIVEDAVLGTMVLDRELDWFNGERALGSTSYKLSVIQTSSENDREANQLDVQHAAQVVQRFEADLPVIRAAIVRDQLSLYNHTWREQGPELDGEEFIAHVSLESAVIDPGGRVTLYFDDGGLFYGHAIEVRLNADGSVRETCLAG
jgi:hypothetical protein